ncbi:DNA-processing protein DprA [Sphingomonas glaciei]|uniref:DNA-processing protein DprA n=1 Tax=Sphingomonas glaciei TaxID=2938948 RepID=A0ABY5MVQ1_9SPHN|nr:DNA-processing protein DprA [Sphingomonas glaciei]UUR08061.1 DNA-processing protein DprA [Sphingomonas glaciei]
MSGADLLARIRLIRSQSIGPVTFRQLLARFGSAEAALQAVPDLAARGGGRMPALCSEEQAERERARVEALGGRYLSLGQGLYPSLLAESDNAPPLLTAIGDLSLLERPSVAMVGARNASAAACRFARGLAHDLGREGVVVVSGLARGIDAAAHEGGLATGTIGVIAGGLDIFYPPENERLQREMAAKGLVLAEMPPGTEPRARHFPYRNRIIAGLCPATLVVEAAPRSGSLITARLAAEMGREVLAVPGSPLDPRAQGCNGLIRDGATLVQNAAEVMEALRPGLGGVRSGRDLFSYSPEVPASVEPDGAERARVEELLGPSPAPVDEIVRLSGLEPGAVQLVLLELDLAGRLDRHAGGKVSLR